MPSNTVDAALERILRHLEKDEATKDVVASLSGPANDRDFGYFQKKTGLTLPVGLADLDRPHDDQRTMGPKSDPKDVG